MDASLIQETNGQKLAIGSLSKNNFAETLELP